MFGWFVLAAMAAFLINVVLTFWFGFPGIGSLVGWETNAPPNGLEWLQATPRSAESTFEKILMAFNAQAELVIMELNDTFGHKTVLRFSAMQRNPKFPAQQFQFTPPKGADVLGE